MSLNLLSTYSNYAQRNLLIVNPKLSWLTTQVNHISTILNQTKDTNPKHNKRGIINSLLYFLFYNPDGSPDIEATNSNMAILQENQDVVSNQIWKTFIFLT